MEKFRKIIQRQKYTILLKSDQNTATTLF